MVTREEFSNLYALFSIWQKSQEGQTDGYEYERSFEEFVRQMNCNLFKMATDITEREKVVKEREKKKSSHGGGQ